jgi:hypothetical protein
METVVRFRHQCLNFQGPGNNLRGGELALFTVLNNQLAPVWEIYLIQKLGEFFRRASIESERSLNYLFAAKSSV